MLGAGKGSGMGIGESHHRLKGETGVSSYQHAVDGVWLERLGRRAVIAMREQRAVGIGDSTPLYFYLFLVSNTSQPHFSLLPLLPHIPIPHPHSSYVFLQKTTDLPGYQPNKIP